MSGKWSIDQLGAPEQGKRPAIPEPRTISVQDLAALAEKGPQREPVILIGNFLTTDSQGNNVVFRPTQEAHGSLSKQVRIFADYPEGSTPPLENQRQTLTSANRCIVREVKRGADGQINVSARMER